MGSSPQMLKLHSVAVDVAERLNLVSMAASLYATVSILVFSTISISLANY
jgi:hypothetical protein